MPGREVEDVDVLLVEDDLQLGAALARALEQARFETVWVRRLAEARERLALQPAAAVLDINLPDGEGFALLDELRRDGGRLPVLVMTARDSLADRLRGLDGGADDYLVKPFAVSELIARLRAVLRRTAGQASDCWSIGEVTIDAARQQVCVSGVVISLTPTEYRLLVELARAAGKVVTRELLLTRLWSSDESGSDAALEVQVHGLRRKLGAQRIRTVRGSGYALEAV
jgi:two-component system, OmpR family, response regulator QseB